MGQKLPICTYIERFSGLQLSFEFTDGFEIMEKAKYSKDNVPYYFPRSSIEFQGYWGKSLIWTQITTLSIFTQHSK